MASTPTRRLDAAGLGLLVAMAAWTLSSGRGEPGSRPGPIVAGIVGTALVGVAARTMSRRNPVLPGAALALAVALAVIASGRGITRAGSGPLGYANANGTLCVLGVLGAVAALRGTPPGRARQMFALTTILLVGAVVATGSVVSVCLLLVAGAFLVLGRERRWRSALAPVAASLFVLLLGVTAAIAVRNDTDDVPEAVGATGSVRVALWNEAVTLLRDEPLDGHGPGRFEQLSRVSDDADLRWAHHELLQLGAEQGAVGLSLAMALIGWAFLRLGVAALQSERAVTGIAALAVVVAHASVDHVLHHGFAVGLAAAALIGAASVTDRQRHPAWGPEIRG